VKILTAEDESVSRLALTTQLKKLGHDVLASSNGEEAWEIFRTRHPELVITDWIMPKLDGLELCRLIRETVREKYTYIIVLTSFGGKGYYLEGMNAGADDFVTKPFDIDELRARLAVAARILKLQDEVKVLEGLFPMCSYCKRIRDSTDHWLPMDQYITENTDASISHSICPHCYETKVKPQIEELKRNRLAKR
jgi:DNA-binding response OmpR family regulator